MGIYNNRSCLIFILIDRLAGSIFIGNLQCFEIYRNIINKLDGSTISSKIKILFVGNLIIKIVQQLNRLTPKYQN